MDVTNIHMQLTKETKQNQTTHPIRNIAITGGKDVQMEAQEIIYI